MAAYDGLHLLTGGSDRIIDEGWYDKVVADPAGGGWFVQEHSDTLRSPTIRRINDDGTGETIVTAEDGTYVQLHDAGMVDGQATLFFSVNLVREGFGGPDDELFAMDLGTGERSKIMDIGGWETSVDVKFGGGVLVGVWSTGPIVELFSVGLDGRPDPVDVQRAGFLTSYTDDPQAPRAMSIAADGSRLGWLSWNVAGDPYLSQQLVLAATESSDLREFTLPGGPGLGGDLVDHGDYVLVGPTEPGDGGNSWGTLVDVETGGTLVLPVAGPAAARGEWTEPPGWPIPSPAVEDVTDEIRSLEPQWAVPPGDYAEGITQLLLADAGDGDGECAPKARTFPAVSAGDGPFFIELRQFCDDSGAGWLYSVTILGPMPDGSVTGGATRLALCRRGVTADGLCV